MVISHVWFYSFRYWSKKETKFGDQYFKRKAGGLLLLLFSIAFLVLFGINNFNK